LGSSCPLQPAASDLKRSKDCAITCLFETNENRLGVLRICSRGGSLSGVRKPAGRAGSPVISDFEIRIAKTQNLTISDCGMRIAKLKDKNLRILDAKTTIELRQ
jgi:hypothetical protein